MSTKDEIDKIMIDSGGLTIDQFYAQQTEEKKKLITQQSEIQQQSATRGFESEATKLDKQAMDQAKVTEEEMALRGLHDTGIANQEIDALEALYRGGQADLTASLVATQSEIKRAEELAKAELDLAVKALARGDYMTAAGAMFSYNTAKQNTDYQKQAMEMEKKYYEDMKKYY